MKMPDGAYCRGMMAARSLVSAAALNTAGIQRQRVLALWQLAGYIPGTLPENAGGSTCAHRPRDLSSKECFTSSAAARSWGRRYHRRPISRALSTLAFV